MQVGPLAQVLVGFAQGHPLTVKWTDARTRQGRGDREVDARRRRVLHSTLGRHAARADPRRHARRARAEALAAAGGQHRQGRLRDSQPADVPEGREVEGVGFHEAPRGTLSHWVVIKDGKIKNYQAVVPSTWNASPRDNDGAHGPYEASLLHNPSPTPSGRWRCCAPIHSFDPCMACACHTFDPVAERSRSVRSYEASTDCGHRQRPAGRRWHRALRAASARIKIRLQDEVALADSEPRRSTSRIRLSACGADPDGLRPQRRTPGKLAIYPTKDILRIVPHTARSTLTGTIGMPDDRRPARRKPGVRGSRGHLSSGEEATSPGNRSLPPWSTPSNQ